MTLNLDERKKLLLAARLDAQEVQNGVITSPPIVHTSSEGRETTFASEISTRLDNITSPREDSNLSGTGSRSSSRLSVKENKEKGNENNTEGMSVKRPLEFENTDSIEIIEERKPKAKRTEVMDSPEPEKANVVTDSGSRGAGGVKNTIKSYFIPQTDASLKEKDKETPSFHHMNIAASTANSTASTASVPPSTVTQDVSALMPPPAVKTEKAVKGAQTPHQQQQQSAMLELKKQSEAMRIAKDIAEHKALRLEEEFRKLVDNFKHLDERNIRMMKALEEVHRTLALQEFRRRRDKLALDNVRLGRIVSTRTTSLNGSGYVEAWEGGYRKQELDRLKINLKERKDELEARRKRINNLRRAAKKGSVSTDTLADSADASETGTGTSSQGGQQGGDSHRDKERDVMDNDMDLNTETEVIKIHMEQLKKDEVAFAEEERQYASEKAVHLKELKRTQCEENSQFYKDQLPVLNERYLLLSLLGRGGFSEVWKALDLVELREVAVKVHQINTNWSDERKQSFIKHVTREYTIHRDMRHPRVVQLFDVFEIDTSSFATVLEYCKGIDLDERLKRQRTVPEKDAKAIFMQIMSGLRYLNRPHSYLAQGKDRDSSGAEDGENNNNGPSSSGGTVGSRVGAMHHNHGGAYNNHNSGRSSKLSIIHFDLKPANILFDEVGDVKITDFGLSKIIDESAEGTSMELTSQGAGTYWYLPPECFAKGAEAPRISSKVDVWSAGIIFYQMLYGCRPYGEGSSQERVWSEGLIANAGEVNFPALPKVSDEARDLIRQCLTRDQRLRPDVVTVCQHPYMSK